MLIAEPKHMAKATIVNIITELIVVFWIIERKAARLIFLYITVPMIRA